MTLRGVFSVWVLLLCREIHRGLARNFLAVKFRCLQWQRLRRCGCWGNLHWTWGQEKRLLSGSIHLVLNRAGGDVRTAVTSSQQNGMSCGGTEQYKPLLYSSSFQGFNFPSHLSVVWCPWMTQGWVWSTEVAAGRSVKFLMLLPVWILAKSIAVPQSLCCKQLIMVMTIVKCCDFYRSSTRTKLCLLCCHTVYLSYLFSTCRSYFVGLFNSCLSFIFTWMWCKI